MAKRARETVVETAGPMMPKRSRQDILSIRQTLDELAIPRCPLCRAMLIARMRRGGPGFSCACPPRQKKLAA